MATAIPTICRELNSSSGYAWISAAYLIANAISAPIWSKLSDIWGRKIILLTAVAIYFLISIICAVSKDMKMLIIGRTFQGVAGGGLIQIVYATISDIFSMRSRTFYLGLLQMVWATAGGIGPIAGGVLAQYASWRWIFWINLPITGLSFAVLFVFLDVHNPRTKLLPGLQAVDWFGSLSILSFMVMLLLGLNFGGSTFSWSSPTFICLVIFGLVMAFVFWFAEKRAKYPLIPLALFSNPSNIAALVIGFTHDWVGEVESPIRDRDHQTDNTPINSVSFRRSSTSRSTSKASNPLLLSCPEFSLFQSLSYRLWLAYAEASLSTSQVDTWTS